MWHINDDDDWYWMIEEEDEERRQRELEEMLDAEAEEDDFPDDDDDDIPGGYDERIDRTTVTYTYTQRGRRDLIKQQGQMRTKENAKNALMIVIVIIGMIIFFFCIFGALNDL